MFKNLKMFPLLVAILGIICGLQPSFATAPIDVYYYDMFTDDERTWDSRLDRWQARGVSSVIASLEHGPEFPLEEPAARRMVRRRIESARARGLEIEALILQHPRWPLHVEEALWRVDHVLSLSKSYAGGLTAIQIDVEVYTQPELFADGDGWNSFVDLVRHVRRRVDQRAPQIQLFAAAPWWIGHALAQHQLDVLADDLDGIVLMAYGDDGGQPVANTTVDFRRKILPAVEVLSDHDVAFRTGIARYEYENSPELLAHADMLHEHLNDIPEYQGVAVFHDGAGWTGGATAANARKRSRPGSATR